MLLSNESNTFYRSITDLRAAATRSIYPSNCLVVHYRFNHLSKKAAEQKASLTQTGRKKLTMNSPRQSCRTCKFRVISLSAMYVRSHRITRLISSRDLASDARFVTFKLTCKSTALTIKAISFSNMYVCTRRSCRRINVILALARSPFRSLLSRCSSKSASRCLIPGRNSAALTCP